MTDTAAPQRLPLRKGFFNDGPFYVLTSTSLGGSELSADDFVEKLTACDRETTERLLHDGVCLPLFFEGDCALDHSQVVIGNLTAQEEAEWIGRIRGKLNIPCGEFLLQGAFDEIEDALESFEAPDPHYINFCKFRVEPGTYLVEVYAFVGSMSVNMAWDGNETGESLSAWWRDTRPGEAPPPWLESYVKEDYANGQELGLIDYVIRLSPWGDDVPLPEISEVANDFQWCGAFEMRKPEKCPAGIERE
jgi:hypothetical protein